MFCNDVVQEMHLKLYRKTKISLAHSMQFLCKYAIDMNGRTYLYVWDLNFVGTHVRNSFIIVS